MPETDLTLFSSSAFHLQINSLDVFMAFCAVIRGELAYSPLTKLSADLKSSTADLAAAQAEASVSRPLP